jgi:glycosyltransferase involved in cell wall biosynthesis
MLAMRIAQVAPLVERVPPPGYGGTERVVFYLTEELVKEGHDVTLFASGDSRTSAHLVACAPRSLRLDEAVIDPLAHQVVQLEAVAAAAHRFDIIHWHVDYFHFPMSRRLAVPNVTTLHGRLDIPDLQPVYDDFREMPVVSISDDQRAPLPQANWAATVHHGMPLEELLPHLEPGDYLAFLGRISPEKRADRAIEVARRARMPLRIAAKVDDLDRAYFEREIEPLLEQDHVDFVGEIGPQEKNEFLGKARALLFPIDWNEPFGLAMIEAMACATPVIAYRSGSVPEVIDEGVSGYIVDDIESATAAVGRLDVIDRAGVRAAFERRFDVARMAHDYVAVYERLIAGWGRRGTVAIPAATEETAAGV